VCGLQEAAVLEDCVRYLVERCKLQPGQLGVITPYAAQVALLGKRLQKQGFNVNGSGRSSSWDSQDGKCAACQQDWLQDSHGQCGTVP
jgi:hypothetical protein